MTPPSAFIHLVIKQERQPPKHRLVDPEIDNSSGPGFVSTLCGPGHFSGCDFGRRLRHAPRRPPHVFSSIIFCGGRLLRAGDCLQKALGRCNDWVRSHVFPWKKTGRTGTTQVLFSPNVPTYTTKQIAADCRRCRNYMLHDFVWRGCRGSDANSPAADDFVTPGPTTRSSASKEEG